MDDDEQELTPEEDAWARARIRQIAEERTADVTCHVCKQSFEGAADLYEKVIYSYIEQDRFDDIMSGEGIEIRYTCDTCSSHGLCPCCPENMN